MGLKMTMDPQNMKSWRKKLPQESSSEQSLKGNKQAKAQQTGSTYQRLKLLADR